jgi:hypothetical protein
VKGQGDMTTYFVLCKLDDDGRSIKVHVSEVWQDSSKKAEVPKRKEGSGGS